MSAVTIQKADRESLETLSRFCMWLFSKGFSLEGQEKGIMSLLQECLNVDTLHMAVRDGMLCGVYALSDGKTRAVTATAGQFRKALGLVLGTVAYPIIKKEMMDAVDLGDKAAVIEWMLAADADTEVLTAMTDHIRQQTHGPCLLYSFDPAADPFFEKRGFVKTGAHSIAPGMEKRVFEG